MAPRNASLNLLVSLDDLMMLFAMCFSSIACETGTPPEYLRNSSAASTLPACS